MLENVTSETKGDVITEWHVIHFHHSSSSLLKVPTVYVQLYTETIVTQPIISCYTSFETVYTGFEKEIEVIWESYEDSVFWFDVVRMDWMTQILIESILRSVFYDD